MIPKSLEKKRDELSKLIIEHHACWSGDCTHSSQKECDLTVLAHSFEDGVKAVLESAELKGLVSNLTRLERLIGDWPHNGPRISEALTNWNKFIGGEK